MAQYANPSDEFTAAAVVEPETRPDRRAKARTSLGIAVDQPPVRMREVLAVLLLVALCDITIYRGAGFAGCALLIGVAPALLVLGTPRCSPRANSWLIGCMLLLLAARLVWIGSTLAVAAGFALLAAFSLAMHGRRAFLLDVLYHALQTVVAGYRGLACYRRSAARFAPPIPRILWLNLALPLAALVLFSALFILANPHLTTIFVDSAGRFFRSLGDWAERLADDWLEVCFWIAAAWISVGLLRPILPRALLAALRGDGYQGDPTDAEPLPPRESPLYGALRNTLVAVIVLFAVYLVFEFQTLWFREFPPGFHYSGYAHEGAAWLTAALAVATLVLSLIFRGGVLADARIGRLRKLAWIWSAENLVLALTVYNRMYIYIDFNGMTRMRTIGLFGISAVVVGFCLVLLKIVRGHTFGWLIQRQLWTLAIAVYLFLLTPVDAIIHRYNVRHILAGDLAPSVQISVHPINAEGLLVLDPLLESRDPIIREGVRALLAQRAIRAEQVARERAQLGWTAFQLADHRLLEKLRATREDWKVYLDDSKRSAALERFHDYAYQWY